MGAYSAMLESMMQTILVDDLLPARSLYRNKPDFTPEEQLSIYTQGYRLRLVDVLEGAYPALHDYVGAEQFGELAKKYIAGHPSRTFNIDKYPIMFGEYSVRNCHDVFAQELAALERAIHEVYQMPESMPLNATWLEEQTPESLMTATLRLRVASALLAFTTPLADYYTAFRAGEKPTKPEPAASYLLVVRHQYKVQRLPLAQGEYTLLFLLAQGYTLEQAFEHEQFAPFVANANLASDFHQWFARWVREGVLRLA